MRPDDDQPRAGSREGRSSHSVPLLTPREPSPPGAAKVWKPIATAEHCQCALAVIRTTLLAVAFAHEESSGCAAPRASTATTWRSSTRWPLVVSTQPPCRHRRCRRTPPLSDKASSRVLAARLEHEERRYGRISELLLSRTSGHVVRRDERHRGFCSWSGSPGSGSHGAVAAEATERKPRLSASEFRFGPIVSSGPASRRTDACSVSAQGREGAGAVEMPARSRKRGSQEWPVRTPLLLSKRAVICMVALLVFRPVAG
jgi:hypothetical protein